MIEFYEVPMKTITELAKDYGLTVHAMKIKIQGAHVMIGNKPTEQALLDGLAKEFAINEEQRRYSGSNVYYKWDEHQLREIIGDPNPKQAATHFANRYDFEKKISLAFVGLCECCGCEYSEEHKRKNFKNNRITPEERQKIYGIAEELFYGDPHFLGGPSFGIMDDGRYIADRVSHALTFFEGKFIKSKETIAAEHVDVIRAGITWISKQ